MRLCHLVAVSLSPCIPRIQGVAEHSLCAGCCSHFQGCSGEQNRWVLCCPGAHILVNEINRIILDYPYEGKGELKGSMHFIKWSGTTWCPTLEWWVEWGVRRGRISQAEERASTETLWGEGQTGILGVGGVRESRMKWGWGGSRRPGHNSLHVTRVRSFRFPLSVMGSHWNKEHTALVRLCQWPHISIVLIFWVTHWYVDTADPRPGYKLISFLEMTQNTVFTATVHSSHTIEAFICPHRSCHLWWSWLVEGLWKESSGHSACLVCSCVALTNAFSGSLLV